MKIANRRCDECLFSDARIVPIQRATEVLQECIQGDAHFICHKASLRDDDVMCRGHYDAAMAGRLPMPGLLKMCGRAGILRFVDPATSAVRKGKSR